MSKPVVNLLSTNSELQSVTFRILLVETSGSAAADEDMVLVKCTLGLRLMCRNNYKNNRSSIFGELFRNNRMFTSTILE